MGIVVGIDEAGLGPNLGPFVVTAVVWEVPGPPRDFDFWTALSSAVTNDHKAADGRVIIGDSKQLFQPLHGLGRLEQSVHALIASMDARAGTLRELTTSLSALDQSWEHDPWLTDVDLALPADANPAPIEASAARLRQASARLQRIVSRVVSAADFNRRLECANKAEVATRCHLDLLHEVCRESPNEILVYSDKHGGRNRYAAALSDVWNGEWMETIRESSQQSHYRGAGVEFFFEPRAERHLPVAAASMVSKYLRELHMRLFNRFWSTHIPGLKPTQGYPVDARRFACDIDAVRDRLGIALDQVWRRK